MLKKALREREAKVEQKPPEPAVPLEPFKLGEFHCKGRISIIFL